MASYNSQEFTNMQKEALDRVNDMHKRSQQIINGANNRNGNMGNGNFNNNGFNHQNHNNQINQNSQRPETPPEPDIENFQKNTINNNQQNNQQFNNPLQGLLNGNLFNSKLFGDTKDKSKSDSNSQGLLSSLLDGFNIDEEKAMIGLLIYVLAKNGADVKLLLALGYLLL